MQVAVAIYELNLPLAMPCLQRRKSDTTRLCRLPCTVYVLVRVSAELQRQTTPLPDRPMAPMPQRVRCGDGCGHSPVLYNVRSRPRERFPECNLVT